MRRATKVITVSLPEETWKELKRRAALLGKSISAFVRERLEEELGKERFYMELDQRLRALAREVGGHLEGWDREELYDV
ncbi:ribbon-helix-helix protein, CopG family [Thermosulfurimonas sp. F29]|uniref:ribbon-helix-helix protein, CopG family n=1 Tax=Thermosulfurimonas sp. F29 TaxID=2867247 RepID=UPI001C832B94|nr:ribbon-helix-helix protein, CopG family [Thermosulfurimonas sp. F29]MBX6422870.1 ribbon-helix-helix protein, CopG family [Thermosulfurimonas sp. F29]